ncbi:hypothetical protein FPOA_03356 [Fusarium poae]|uniref:Uncharacterized protein n=1 Tax=Fusarium poae TaxID=36050 RepID=A0A1B8B9M5_FUSPO|nr:hypothetical protein FPOA_03356 [Fusarium poae]
MAKAGGNLYFLMAPAPLSPDSAKCTFETELPYGLGSTNPCPTAVHMEPYCSSRGRSAPCLITAKPPELFKPGRLSSWRDTERYSVRDTDLYVSAKNISSLPLQTTTPFAHQKAKACQFSAGPTYQPFRPPTLIKRPSYLFSDESDPRRSLQTTICLANRLSGSFFERKHAHWRHCHQPPSTRGHLPWHGWPGLVGNMNGGASLAAAAVPFAEPPDLTDDIEIVAVAIPNLDTTGDQREYGALSATGITRTQHELEKEMNRDAITRHDCAGTNETGEINGCGTVTHSRLCRSLRSDGSGPASELQKTQDEIIQHLFIIFVTYSLAQERLPRSSLPQNRHIPRASWLSSKRRTHVPCKIYTCITRASLLDLPLLRRSTGFTLPFV